jgi:di/tricarboxylate transporter
MTDSILTVFGVLAGAVALFAWGRPRSDIVAILVVLALNLTGVLTIQETLSGFGQPVVALIAAVSIVSEGLIATGVAYRLGEAVMKAGGGNEAHLVALVMVLAGTVGAFMSSSAIVAMFIPVVLAIASKVGLNRKRMLMPLSIAALISGMMTLIASSPNMIVEDTLRSRGLAPLSFFEWTPFGIAVLAVAIGFMLVAGRNMLSRQTTAEETGTRQPTAHDLLESYALADKWILPAHPWPVARLHRCSCLARLASLSSALRNASMAESNSCRRCLKASSGPMTQSSSSAVRTKRSSLSGRMTW